MDLDEALERVVLAGEVVARPEWGPDDCIVRFWTKERQVGWRTTRIVSCPDMVADDWRVIGHLH
jgi:hypothetical protein